MGQIGPACLAGVIGLVVTALELVTSKYPRTFPFLKTCKAFYAYIVIYGLISFFAMLGLKALINAGTIKLEGMGLSSPWVQAIAIGLSTKALLHIRLFSATVGSQQFPIGVESIVQLFEPWLLDTAEQDEFNEVRSFLAPKAANYPGLPAVQSTITTNLRPSLPPAEKVALVVDVNKAVNVIEAMEIYLRRFGRRSLERIFP